MRKIGYLALGNARNERLANPRRWSVGTMRVDRVKPARKPPLAGIHAAMRADEMLERVMWRAMRSGSGW